MDLNEKIIESVRKHTCLYKLSDKQYKNAVLKARLWQQSADQLKENSDTIKKKWKSMRYGYIKYKKQVKGTTGCERKTISFMWSAQLSFLDSDISPSETASNISESSQTQTANFDIPPSLPCTPATTSTNAEYSETSLNTDTPSNQSFQPTATPRRAKRIAEPDLDDMIMKYLDDKKEKPNHAYDSVDYLFLSYAQTFKKLSQRKQSMLKVDLAKLFSEAELSEMEFEYVHSPYSVVSSVNSYNDTNVGQFNNTTVYSIHSDNAQYTNIPADNMTEQTNNMPQNLTVTTLTELPSTSFD